MIFPPVSSRGSLLEMETAEAAAVATVQMTLSAASCRRAIVANPGRHTRSLQADLDLDQALKL